MAEDKKISKDLQEDSKRRIKNEADFQDVIKDSLNLLKQMDASYEKLEARINSMNKSSINIKDVNREIQKATEKQFTAEKQLSELKHADTDEVKAYLDNLKYINDLEIKIRNSKGEEKKSHKEAQALLLSYKDDMFEILSAEEQSYANALQTVKIGQEGLHIAQAQLSTEKQIEKSIGVTGKAMGILATKLGLGSEYYEDMVEKARELNKRGEEFTFGDKLKSLKKLALGAFKEGIKDPLVVLPALYKGVSKGLDTLGGAVGKTGKFMGGLSENSTGVVSNLTSGMSGMLKNIPMVGGLLGGLVDGFSGVADLLLGANDQIVKAGRNLGLSSAQAETMMHHFQDVSMSNNDIYVTSKKLLETQVEIGGQLGINNQLTDEQLSTLTKLKDLAGIDAETQASIAESSTITGNSAEDTTKAVLAQVIGLQKATGISLNQKQILKESANLGGYLGLSFAKYPGQLSKALVTAKSFGLELKQLDSIADSFLDFESSISNEFEAQLLTGKDINLTKAREAFLNNDLATAAGEISSQVGSSADFMKLNRIQAESLAKSMGMSRDQLGDMLKKQEMLAKIGAKETDSSAKQFELAKNKFKTQEEFNAALGDEAFQNMQNASTQEKIAAYMDKLKTSIVDFVERSHLIDKIENFIDYLSNPKNMQGVLNTIKGVIASAIEFFGGVASNVAGLISHMPFTDTQKWQDIADKIDAGTASAASGVRGVGLSMPETVSDKKAKTEGAAATALQSAGSTSAPKIVVQNNQEFNINPYTAKVTMKQVSESSTTSTDKATGLYGKQ